MYPGVHCYSVFNEEKLETVYHMPKYKAIPDMH